MRRSKGEEAKNVLMRVMAGVSCSSNLDVVLYEAALRTCTLGRREIIGIAIMRAAGTTEAREAGAPGDRRVVGCSVFVPTLRAGHAPRSIVALWYCSVSQLLAIATLAILRTNEILTIKYMCHAQQQQQQVSASCLSRSDAYDLRSSAR